MRASCGLCPSSYPEILMETSWGPSHPFNYFTKLVGTQKLWAFCHPAERKQKAENCWGMTEKSYPLFSWNIGLGLQPWLLQPCSSLVFCPTLFCRATTFFLHLVYKLVEAMLLTAQMLVLRHQFKACLLLKVFKDCMWGRLWFVTIWHLKAHSLFFNISFCTLCQGTLEAGPDFLFFFSMTEDYDKKKKSNLNFFFLTRTSSVL